MINVFSFQDIGKGNFNPDVDGLPEEVKRGTRDAETIPTFDRKCLNAHYFIVMSGESSAKTDFRKPIKAKPKKKAAKPKVKAIG